jgi:hypothetical protein
MSVSIARTRPSFVLLTSVVFSLTLSCVERLDAQSGVTIGFNGSGLSSLQYQGTEFLSYGDLRLTQIDFLNADGTTSKGNVNGSVSVNTAQQTQTRTYSWGTIGMGYAASGNRLNLTVTVTNQSAATIKGIWFEPLGLRFPARVQEYDGNIPLLVNTVGKP